jgi:hypothetical protein
MLAHNRKRMQRLPYSREEHFLAVEKPALRPLPETDFEIIAYSGEADPPSGDVDPSDSRRADRRSSFFDLSKKASTKLMFFSSHGITFQNYFM